MSAQPEQPTLTDTPALSTRTGGLTDTTRARACPDCWAPTLAVIEYARITRVDPTPLTPAGELTALLTGRPTYTHVNGYLNRRYAFMIDRHPADQRDVHAVHQCHAAPLDTFPIVEPETTARPVYTQCPF